MECEKVGGGVPVCLGPQGTVYVGSSANVSRVTISHVLGNHNTAEAVGYVLETLLDVQTRMRNSSVFELVNASLHALETGMNRDENREAIQIRLHLVVLWKLFGIIKEVREFKEPHTDKDFESFLMQRMRFWANFSLSVFVYFFNEFIPNDQSALTLLFKAVVSEDWDRASALASLNNLDDLGLFLRGGMSEGKRVRVRDQILFWKRDGTWEKMTNSRLKKVYAGLVDPMGFSCYMRTDLAEVITAIKSFDTTLDFLHQFRAYDFEHASRSIFVRLLDFVSVSSFSHSGGQVFSRNIIQACHQGPLGMIECFFASIMLPRIFDGMSVDDNLWRTITNNFCSLLQFCFRPKSAFTVLDSQDDPLQKASLHEIAARSCLVLDSESSCPIDERYSIHGAHTILRSIESTWNPAPKISVHSEPVTIEVNSQLSSEAFNALFYSRSLLLHEHPFARVYELFKLSQNSKKLERDRILYREALPRVILHDHCEAVRLLYEFESRFGSPTSHFAETLTRILRSLESDSNLDSCGELIRDGFLPHCDTFLLKAVCHQLEDSLRVKRLREIETCEDSLFV